jgi:hypothetical protein
VFAASEALLKPSTWHAERAPLPLSPRRAEEIAAKEAHLIRPDVPGWRPFGVELSELDSGADCWTYVITLIREDFLMGQPESLKVPVLMNGSAVHPVSQH